MDPNVTLGALIESCQDGDFDLAQDFARDLQTWLAKGGFNPDITQAHLEGTMDALFHVLEQI